jgi:hypothetical protein
MTTLDGPSKRSMGTISWAAALLSTRLVLPARVVEAEAAVEARVLVGAVAATVADAEAEAVAEVREAQAGADTSYASAPSHSLQLALWRRAARPGHLGG